MADGVFNVSKGRVIELHDRAVNSDPTNAAVLGILLAAAETDATLIDYDDLSTLLAAAGNTEATADNYARLVLDTELSSSTVDDTNDRREGDMPDPSWTDLGGTTDHALAKFLTCYDSDSTSGTDSNVVPMTHHDAVLTSTNGSTVTLNVPATGYSRAS